MPVSKGNIKALPREKTMSITGSRAVLVGLALALTACASGYKTFYKPAAGSTADAIASRRAAPPGEPIVERSPPPGDQAGLMLDSYAKRGFVLIGSSSFNTGQPESEQNAVQQGRDVGADLVLILNPRYTGSTTTAMPWTTPTTSTTYSSGTATAYGPGGTVSAYGSGTSTTYGTQTTYIPITIHRSDYGAVYFIKAKWGFGVMWRDLNDSERQELQTNKGIYVRLVVDNTPAFYADVLPGDIVLAINGEQVLNQQSASDLLRRSAGQKVMVSLYRRGQRIEKEVQLQ